VPQPSGIDVSVRPKASAPRAREGRELDIVRDCYKAWRAAAMRR
jgi:hypothetical protein